MAESKEFIKLLDDIRDMHKRKNDGYAGKDAEDPWANFRMAEMLGISAFQGCLVRMSDKFIRVCNLSKDPTNEQVGEHITDTLMDLAVYSLIAICLHEERNYDENNATFEGVIKNPPKTIIDKDAFKEFTVADIEHATMSFKESMERFSKTFADKDAFMDASIYALGLEDVEREAMDKPLKEKEPEDSFTIQIKMTGPGTDALELREKIIDILESYAKDKEINLSVKPITYDGSSD